MYFWSEQSVLCVCPFFMLMMLDQVNLFFKVREITVLNSEKNNPLALRQMTVNSKILKRPRNTQKMDLFTKYSKMCKSQISLKRLSTLFFGTKHPSLAPFFLLSLPGSCVGSLSYFSGSDSWYFWISELGYCLPEGNLLHIWHWQKLQQFPRAPGNNPTGKDYWHLFRNWGRLPSRFPICLYKGKILLRKRRGHVLEEKCKKVNKRANRLLLNGWTHPLVKCCFS